MADFVAVLKKTIDGLGETTPDTRARVYEKARATITAKLAALSPPPAPAVIERQKAALEQAIKSIEAEYAPPPPPPSAIDDDFEAVMASLAAPVEVTPPPPTRAAPPPAPAPEPAPRAPVAAPAPVRDEDPAPQAAADATDMPGAVAGERLSTDSPTVAPSRRAPSRGRVGLAAVALIVLVFAGAAGYAVWLNRDEVSQMVGLGTPAQDQQTAEPVAQPPADEPAQDVAAVEPAAPQTPAAPAAPAEPTPPAAGEQVVPKFTQKLNPDGTETDQGPAGGAPGVGEGNSVAALTVQPPGTVPATPPAADTAAAPPAADAAAPAADQTAQAAPTAPAAGDDTSAAVPVGQRAIFYEERTSASGGSAEAGTTVWSLVQESPGGDLPAEAAIRADVTIPGKEVQLRMTVRRNGDPTLPASHIVELIFLTPENFEGGVIDNLLRMTMKETEEATGNPLLGVPAKIGDGFFLIALSDGKAENETNMQLFRRMKWIDIPIVYRSGRRALMTVERGIPGDKVFEDALRAWSQANG